MQRYKGVFFDQLIIDFKSHVEARGPRRLGKKMAHSAFVSTIIILFLGGMNISSPLADSAWVFLQVWYHGILPLQLCELLVIMIFFVSTSGVTLVGAAAPVA
jgi:hypothetical protein